MAMPDLPQLYLITPSDPSPSAFPETLARVLDAAPVACLRLRMASEDEGEIARMADAVRGLAHVRDIPLVIDRHLRLVQPLGLDGVHLSDGARGVRQARKALGSDAIIGAFCGASRHDGMTAGEAGADYIAFGPVGHTALGTGEPADPDIFAWWSDMVELPVVAEGAVGHEELQSLAPITDFFALGDEIWRSEDPPAALVDIARRISQTAAVPTR